MAAPLRTMVHGPWPEKGCSRPSRSEASLKVLTSLVLVKHRNEFCSSSFFVAPADDRSAWRNPGLDCCLAHSFKTQDLPHGLAGGLRHDSICSSDGCTLHSGSQGEHIESPRGGRSTDKCLARMQGDGSTQPSVLYGMVSCSACSGNGKANLPLDLRCHTAYFVLPTGQNPLKFSSEEGPSVSTRSRDQRCKLISHAE